jgi:hypothetical protein
MKELSHLKDLKSSKMNDGYRWKIASDTEAPRLPPIQRLKRRMAKDNHRSRCLGQAWTKQRKNISKHWLTRSVWPSDCGSYAKDILNCTFPNLNNSVRKWLVKTRSLSETIESGSP